MEKDYNKHEEIKNVKKDIVLNELDSLFDFADSDVQKKEFIYNIINKLKNNELCTELTEQYEIDADAINLNQAQIAVDLLTNFGVIEKIDSKIDKDFINDELNIINIKNAIGNVKDKLESCRNTLSEKHMPNCRIERFRNNQCFELERKYQYERYGGLLPKKSYVLYDNEQNYITLPLIRQDNSLRYDNKVATAYVNKHFQLGEGYLTGSEYTDLENMIDQNRNTFWSETILADAPFKVSFNHKDNREVYAKDYYYYNVDNGAVCELVIDYESVNTVNEINLLPYTKYPIEIISIRYKLTDDEDEELKELVSPDAKEEVLKSVSIDSKKTFRFPDILCKKIYIAFVQKHYERNVFVYNQLDMYKNELWFNSVENREDKEGLIYKPLYDERRNNVAILKSINKKVTDFSNVDIASAILNKENTNRKQIKYEYKYGFYNISCMNNHYDRVGIYVSEKYKMESNIKNIQISTEEEHQNDTLGNMVTDVEYYITASSNPGPRDWTPILPVNKKTIESELLIITGEQRAYLRFEAESVISIMKNGVPIKDSHTYHLHVNERTGKVFCVQMFNYDFDSVYSISYVPVKSAYTVDYSNSIISSVENYESNGGTYVELENTPYILENITVSLIDTTEHATSKKIIAKNVTDKEDTSISYKNFDKTTNDYQFYCYQNSIYFNREIKPGFIIEVSYKHLISNFRIKAYLRRNTNTDGWLTPTVKSIKYDVNTF